MSENRFDQHMQDWRAWQAAPWGRLRYSIAQKNLQRHLPEGVLQILDIGGGNGVEALALAQQGHDVTLVDTSEAMLQDAQNQAEAAGIAERMEMLHADAFKLAQRLQPNSYDVVLCHNLIQYVQEPLKLLQEIKHLLRPEGIASVICLNPASAIYKLALAQADLQGARAQLEASTAPPNLFGAEVHQITAEELLVLLEQAELAPIGRYGIRCVCDYIQDNERKHDPQYFAELEQLELALSGVYPYYTLARLTHIIAQAATTLEALIEDIQTTTNELEES